MPNPNLALNSRRSIRLPGYDYRQAGIYFVTLCTYRHTSLFGSIVEGDMILNELGKVVEEEWQRVAKLRRNVKLDLSVVMPNHMHGLLIIETLQDCDSVRAVPASGEMPSGTLKAGSLGAIIGQFKLAVARQANFRHLHLHKKIWQRNYHEHIVRSEESLNDIRRYIMENPARWSDDSLYLE